MYRSLGWVESIKNNMIKTEFVSVDDLVLLKNNPRKITDEKFKALCVSIKENPDYFWARPVLANNASGKNIVYAGNQRLRAAKELGMEKVPCIIENLTEEQEKERTVRDNVELGEWDFEMLAGDDWNVEDLAKWGVELPVVEVVIEDGETDPDDVPEVPTMPKTVRGDLYEIGEHRVLCGDSTVLSDVEKLMNKEKTPCVLTDPPYGIEYFSFRKNEKIENDKEGDLDLMEVVANIYAVSEKNCAVYVFFGKQNMIPFLEMFEKFHVLIWNKGDFGFGKEYRNSFEPLLYHRIGSPLWNGGTSKKDVLDFNRNRNSSLHPTMKPNDILVEIIKNSSNTGDIVLDLFGGSGATLIASEQLKRKCRMMELDEKYCDVIVNRWLAFTGKTEFKLNGKTITKDEWAS
jgi:DNA modification methylase